MILRRGSLRPAEGELSKGAAEAYLTEQYEVTFNTENIREDLLSKIGHTTVVGTQNAAFAGFGDVERGGRR